MTLDRNNQKWAGQLATDINLNILKGILSMYSECWDNSVTLPHLCD